MAKNIYPDQVVRAIDRTKVRYKYCIGYCANCKHSGFVTSRILQEHDCLGKSCNFFKPIKTNSYWYRKELDEKVKKEIKDLKKERRNIENEILNRVPEESKAILSKHLYDKTYLLAIEGDYLNNREEIFGDMDVNIYIKKISPEEVQNYDVTFLKSLPEEMKERFKKEKQKIKNDREKRRG